MTIKPNSPALPWSNFTDGHVVTAAEYDNYIVNWGNYLDELLRGVNADKIPVSAIGGLAPYYGNALVNSGFEQYSRGVTSQAAAGIMADRWVVQFNGTTSSTGQQQSTSVDNNSQYALVCSVAGAGTSVYVYQNVDNYAMYRGATMTFSVRTINQSTAFVQLYDGVNTYTSSNYAISAAYQTMQISGAISTASTTLRCLIGLNAPAGIYVDNAQLVVGNNLVPNYYPLSQGDEIRQCCRYYQKIYHTNRYLSLVASHAKDATITFPVAMAGVPTVTIAAGTRSNVASVTNAVVGTRHARFQTVATAGSAGGVDTYSIGDAIALEYNP